MAARASTQSALEATGWRQGLAGQLGDLGRWIEGRLVLEPDPSAEVVPAERYFDLDYLRVAVARARVGGVGQVTEASLRQAGDAGNDDDVGDDEELEAADVLAVSRFSRQYTSSLSAVALVGLARGVGLDMSPAHCRLVMWRDLPFRTMLELDDTEVLRCDARPAPWAADGPSVSTVAELREHVWHSLYAHHIGPLFERLRQITRVSRNLTWSNAAEWVGLTSDGAEEHLASAAAAPFVDDRVAVLGLPQLPGIDGPNPLRNRLDWVPADDGASGFPRTVQTRRICCGTYLMPDRDGRLCQNCPFLPLDDRVALIRERHGVSIGQPGGPAERRSIEHGRRRVRQPDVRPSSNR